MLIRITHRPSGELIAEGPRGWGITPFEGNYYIGRRHLKTSGFKTNYIPGLCIYKFLYVWMDFQWPGDRSRNLGWLYWLPNPLFPFIWFRVAVPGKHPDLQVELITESQVEAGQYRGIDMEQTLGFWVAPLLLIPGMALLVLSTSARYNQLILHVASKPQHSRLQRQLPLLRYALIALYLGIAVNAVAALLAHILTANEQLAKSIILVLSCGGVACLLIAVVCLIIDTTHSELRHIERPIEGD